MYKISFEDGKNFLIYIAFGLFALGVFSRVVWAAEVPTKEGGGLAPYEGATQEVTPGGKGMEEPVSLDLRNIDVVEALRFIALKGGFNLAVTKGVSGRLFLLLNDVPIKDVLDIILRTNNLAYEKQGDKGDIYSVMTETEYKERYGRNFGDLRKVKIFRLKYAIPERVFAALDALKSEVGRVLVDQESGVVLVMDTEQNLKKIEDVVNALEQRRSVMIFPLMYAKAKDLEERLKTQLDAKGVGSIIADERSNQLVVQTLPDRMDAIAQLIRSLDKKTKEVLIVSKIIKVTLSDNLNTEIQWEGLFKQMNPFPFLRDGGKNELSFIGNHPTSNLARVGTSFVDDFVTIAPTTRPAAGSKNTFTENLFFGQLGEDSFEVLLKFLRTIGKTKVLSSPRILVVNNQEAKIHVGERQAYVTTTTTTGQTTTTTAEAVTFVDIGIQLSVTPTINDDGYVSMKIKPSISSVTSTLTTPSGNKIPIIDTSEAETAVMVKDNTSVVLAGLRKDDYDESKKQVPYLADIPGLGRLFKSGTKNRGRTELLVLLTPHIVEGNQLVTGEPQPAAQGMKGYKDYSSLSVKPEKKPSWFHPISSFMKKVTFVGNE